MGPLLLYKMARFADKLNDLRVLSILQTEMLNRSKR